MIQSTINCIVLLVKDSSPTATLHPDYQVTTLEENGKDVGPSYHFSDSLRPDFRVAFFDHLRGLKLGDHNVTRCRSFVAGFIDKIADSLGESTISSFDVVSFLGCLITFNWIKSDTESDNTTDDSLEGANWGNSANVRPQSGKNLHY